MTKQTQDSQRRRFFRIDDEICLEYDLISEEEYADAARELEQIKQSSFGLSAEFTTLNYEHNSLLNSIRANHPEIAQYFDFLNGKVDALSQRLLEEDMLFEESQKQAVNLSASGIAFNSEQVLKNNQPLRIRMVLFPEKIGIMVFGRVQHDEDTRQHDKLIRVDFEHIRADDQELMIKHNLNKQMLELRKRSENNDR